MTNRYALMYMAWLAGVLTMCGAVMRGIYRHSLMATIRRLPE